MSYDVRAHNPLRYYKRTDNNDEMNTKKKAERAINSDIGIVTGITTTAIAVARNMKKKEQIPEVNHIVYIIDLRSIIISNHDRITKFGVHETFCPRSTITHKQWHR